MRRKVSMNNSLANIKLLKTHLSKIVKSRRHRGKPLTPLLKSLMGFNEQCA